MKLDKAAISKTVERELAQLAAEHEREARFRQRSSQWADWLDATMEAEVEGGGDRDPDPADFLPEALAAHHDALDEELATINARWRAENGQLRRQVITAEIAHASERRQRVEEASALRRRITVLEAQLANEQQARAEFAKALACMQREIAKDRAVHRMRDDRRLLPHAQRADLERARRKTDRALIDRAIEDRLSEGGFDA